MRKLLFVIMIILLNNFVMGASEMNILNYEDTPIYLKCHDLLMTAKEHLKNNEVKEAYKCYEKIASNPSFPQTYRTDAEFQMSILSGNQNPYSSKSFLKPTDTKTDFYVSLSGNDNNNGTETSPFLTIAKAVETINSATSEGPFGIILKEGDYYLTDSINLDTITKPVVFKSLGKVRFLGGIEVKEFHPLTDENILKKIRPEAKGKIYECDLFAQGVKDIKDLTIKGSHMRVDMVPNIDVYKDNKLLTLARYPNEGYLDVEEVVSPGDVENNIPSIFTYKDDRISSWAEVEDLWLNGYFRYRWAVRTIKVSQIDPEKKQVIMNPGYEYVKGSPMDNSQGILFYGFNLIEELDCDGEYYIDRKQGKLYIYSDDDIKNHKIEISLLDKPFFTGKNVKNISFENIEFDLGEDRFIKFETATEFGLYNCKVTRFGNSQILIDKAEKCFFYGSEFANTSKGCIFLTGGDREKLIPSQTIIENCKIHDMGKDIKTGSLGVSIMEGCGFIIKYNDFYNSPGDMVFLNCSESLVEFNTFHSCSKEADDQGVIDSYANPTYRGNIVRFNHFYDNGVKNDCGNAAVRLDDVVSGFYIYGNIFERSATGGFGAVQINCGRDNIIDNNIIIDCSYAFSGGYYFGNPDWEPVYKPDVKNDLYYYNDLYFNKYPEMKNDYRPDGNNYMFRNIIINCSSKYPKMFDMDKWGFNPYYVNREPLGVANPEIKGNDIVTKDYKVDQRVAEEIGFSQLPFKEIGNY